MKQKRILKDVRVKGMALTGAPANGEPFILFKSADQGAAMSDKSPELAQLSDEAHEAIRKAAYEQTTDHDRAVLLQSVGMLLKNIDGASLEELLAMAKAADVSLEKAKKDDKADDEEAEDAEAEDDEEDEEDEQDEGHPSLPPAINAKANARAKAKEGMKKSQTTGTQSGNHGGATMPEDVKKSEERVDLSKAHRELLAKHEEMVARLEKTEKELHEQRDAALFKSIKDEVARDFSHLGVDHAELAGILKTSREVKDQAHGEKLTKMLRAINAQAQMSQGGSLFKSSSRTPAFSVATGAGTSRGKLDSLIEERIAKSADGKKTRHDHFLDVMNTPEGKALWAENLQEGGN